MEQRIKCSNDNNDNPDELSKFITTLKSKKLKESKPIKELLQPLIQQFKLNYGLLLDGFRIEPSRQAVLIEDGELNISLYDDQSIVYTSVNDRSSHVNLLSFNPHDNDVELDESLQPSDICINFPVAEITFIADLSESFSNFTNDDEGKLHEMYGHLLPRKILIGGKLFIHGLESVNSNQIDIFNSYLTWVYNSAKYKKEIPFNLSVAQNFFPKITTTDGINLDTHEKLTDWMNNLYQDNTIEIISYNNLVPTSQLKFDTKSFIDEVQPGVANFKKKLTLEDWVKYSKYVKWVKEFQLYQGLIIDQNFELKICEENAIELINFPNIESNDKFYIEILEPTTILEESLINNNIFLINKNEDMNSFPFIKVSDDPSYQDIVYFLVKCERYNVSLNKNNIKPSENFKKEIEKALESMKPFMHLIKVFNKYGHFIPSNILLGKSFKNIIENSSIIPKKIDLVSPVYESLKSHLIDYGINYLLTQNGEIIEENDLSERIQNIKNDLEIIEFNNIIPLYKILEVEQMKRIDTVLNKQDKSKIIMTGIVDLKGSDINNQIIIRIEPSLENKNYEVFGSIVSKNNSELDDSFVTFGSYETNRFFATIETSKNTYINIEEYYYIIWMIVGNPSELSVFCPKNREIQVDCVKEFITLQRNNSSYSIKTSHQLSQGYDISIKNLKFNSNQPKAKVAICTLLRSDHENSNIDIDGKRYPIGYILTENNYRGEPQLEQTNTRNYIDKQYPIKEDRKKLNELIMTNKNLEGHLDLTDFINLEKLDCSNNKLTSLNISKNVKLTEIDCSQNKLINLNLSNCLNIKSVIANSNQLNNLELRLVNNEKLEYLNLLNNSFSQNLNCFSHLFNLKELHIGNTDEDSIKQGIYNRFYGSLKPLKNIIKLESLDINNTDIYSGLEYLPDSIKNFRYSADKRPEAKVVKICEQLNIYSMSSNDAFQGRYNLKAWKKSWKLNKRKKAHQNQNKVEEELALNAKLAELENEKNILQAKEEELIKKNNQLKCKINILKQLLKESDAKLKQQEDVYKQTEQQIETKEKKLGFLIANNLVEKDELEKEIKALKDDLKIKEKDIKQSEKQLEETRKGLRIKEDESASLKNDLDNIRSEIESKKSKLESLKKKLNHKIFFSKRSNKNESAIKAKEIEKRLEEIRKHKEELQNYQINQQACKEKFQKDKENLEHKLKIQNNELIEKEKLISNLQQQNEEKIISLNNEIKGKDEFINKLKQQYEGKITDLNNEIKEWEVLFYNLQRQCDEKTAALNNIIKENEELNEKLQGL
ncbi:unnamed protein product [Rhizophagus irregularis]|nr:unnamed protein product [Rhizophagus irregularis]